MIGRSSDWVLAVAGGVLLALMIEFNSLLARFTSPVYASWWRTVSAGSRRWRWSR